MNTTVAFQRDAFLREEGDRYFERNREMHERGNEIREAVIARIAQHLPAAVSSRVLEIGCADGTNLALLRRLRPIMAYGVDPSREAIGDGRLRHPDADLRTGTADRLSFDDASLDVVWFGFCLYVVDRGLLHRVVAEADRVLADGGLLAIYDFDPDVPAVHVYHHYAGMRSFKMDYSRLFLADPAYVLAEKLSFTHAGLQWSAEPQERVGLWLLRKDVQGGYRPA